MDLSQLRCLVLDMDGTVYLGNRLIGEMDKTLAALRRHGIRLCYFTNNSSRNAKDYAEKLTRLGLFDARDIVYTSAMATVSYLNAHHRGKSVYLLSTPTVREAFLEGGIPLSKENADIVVLAYDTTLTFEKLRVANEMLCRGALYIATHPDMVCPTEDISMPDVGSFIRLLEGSSGRVPDVVIGKPNALAGEAIMAAVGCAREEIAMVGDRLYTDIRFGINAGFGSILVLSGETTREMLDASDVCPSLVLDSLNDLPALLGITP
ncbi:MAG: HAD-IIA family hydrolase [Clostridia bacterium]|nr:HAD-IIA family hydrolase [Clostridia bacterium]